MCGIICGQSDKINENEISQALLKIKHRGPDEFSHISYENKFLGHTRLSIVDLNNGHQPIINETNDIFCVVNGEFYNYQSIRKDLIQKGHLFKTNSDSEILIHLYEEYGVDCLKYLHGEFAFVLYDCKNKRWFCARDRAGIRPLQYYFKNNHFFIASEAKSILEFSVVEKQFDRENFWFSQHLQYLPLDGTLFKNIQMIKPGHFLIFEANSIPKQIEYWNLKNVPVNHLSFEQTVEKAVHLIELAVEKRIPNEVKWTSHLSGGIDSSIVSAISQKYQTQEKTCFTIKFTDDDFYDESILAQETANKIGAKLIINPVSFKDIIEVFPQAIYHGEGLSINGHLGAKYILNQKIREHEFKVALSGEGSDEIFMGYSHLKQDYLSSKNLKISEKQYLSGIQLPDSHTLDLSKLQQENSFIPTWIAAKSSMAYKLKQLWNKNFNYDNDPYLSIAQDLSEYSSDLKSASASWMKYCLNGYILKVLDDGQSMAHSVEGRLPFLDTDLMEFMYSVPDEFYFQNNIEKAILRVGFANTLPSNVINKTKQSFMSPPINRFLNNESFIKLLDEYIFDNQAFKNLDIFDFNQIRQFIEISKNNPSPSVEPILTTILSTGIFINKFNIKG